VSDAKVKVKVFSVASTVKRGEEIRLTGLERGGIVRSSRFLVKYSVVKLQSSQSQTCNIFNDPKQSQNAKTQEEGPQVRKGESGIK